MRDLAEEPITGFGGRYIIVIATPDDTYVYSDPTGLPSAVYNPDAGRRTLPLHRSRHHAGSHEYRRKRREAGAEKRLADALPLMDHHNLVFATLLIAERFDDTA